MGEIIYFNKRIEVKDMTAARRYSDIQQFAKVVLYFVNSSSALVYKTKLNKLLFYAQFLFAKRYGQVFFESQRFIKDHYGPVMENLDSFLLTLQNTGFIDIENNDFGQVITGKVRIKTNDYLKEEEEVLKTILTRFDKSTSREISNISHTESLWQDTPLKGEIDVRRAYELNAF